MRNWTEQFDWDIRIIWDNDESAHEYVRQLVKEADDVWTLSEALSDFYEESIDFILRESPKHSIGNMLVAQICLHPGRDVFDRIASVYWTEKKELEAADA